MQENISWVLFIGFWLLVCLLISFVVKYLPGHDIGLLNNRIVVGDLIKGVLAVVIIALLVNVYSALKYLSCHYLYEFLGSQVDELELEDLVKGLLVLGYIFLVYLLLAKYPGVEEGFGILGAPWAVLYLVSDGRIRLLYEFSKWSVVILSSLTAVYIFLKGKHLIKIVTDVIAEKLMTSKSTGGNEGGKDENS